MNFEDLIIPTSDIEFKQHIGRGAYGEVYTAMWKGRGSGIMVAVKKIEVNLSFIENHSFIEDTKKDIFKEVRILKEIRFQHIVNIFGLCINKEEHELWMVLEYMDGGSLYDYLKQNFAEISLSVQISLLLQAAKAVNHLHSRTPQILHRDIKSPNFLVKPTRDGVELKLTDFGTSKITSLASFSNVRSSYYDVGTLRWSAPETHTQEPDWTSKADIYSLGMTFYEIITGKIPFHTAENCCIPPLVRQNERPGIPQDCPMEIRRLIESCWHLDPDRRPSSKEVLHSLENLSISLVFPISPKRKRAFYEVNEELLLSLVLPERVTVLNDPPPLPEFLSPEDRDVLRVPNQVKVVALKKSENNPLLSSTYDTKLFERVELYFRQFFTPDLGTKIILDQVDVLLNPLINQRFKEAEELLHSTCKGLGELDDPRQSELQREYLSNLLTSDNLYKSRNSNPISCWHGANADKIESIKWYGMLNLRSNDPGYFGAGMYFTQFPKYGEYYAEQLEEKTEGKFKLILCWALLGRPWAVTKVNMGSPCKPTYTSHFTLVTDKIVHPNICETEEVYESIKGLENFFPVLQGEPVKGDEIAIFNSAHVLPRYIVHYTVEKEQQTKFMEKLPIVIPKLLLVPPKPGGERSVGCVSSISTTRNSNKKIHSCAWGPLTGCTLTGTNKQIREHELAGDCLENGYCPLCRIRKGAYVASHILQMHATRTHLLVVVAEEVAMRSIRSQAPNTENETPQSGPKTPPKTQTPSLVAVDDAPSLVAVDDAKPNQLITMAQAAELTTGSPSPKKVRGKARNPTPLPEGVFWTDDNRVTCPIPNCTSTFTRLGSLYRHLEEMSTKTTREGFLGLSSATAPHPLQLCRDFLSKKDTRRVAPSRLALQALSKFGREAEFQHLAQTFPLQLGWWEQAEETVEKERLLESGWCSDDEDEYEDGADVEEDEDEDVDDEEDWNMDEDTAADLRKEILATLDNPVLLLNSSQYDVCETTAAEIGLLLAPEEEEEDFDPTYSKMPSEKEFQEAKERLQKRNTNRGK